jgi:hypothetical protein
MKTHDLGVSQMIRISKLLPALVFFGFGCSEPTETSMLQDLKLTTKDGFSHVIYADGDKTQPLENRVVKYRVCSNNKEVVDRNCPTQNEPAKISGNLYVPRLAASFGVDADIINLGTKDRLSTEIQKTQAKIDGGKLSIAAKVKAEEYLARLTRNGERNFRYFDIIVALEEGDDLEFNESYDDEFQHVISPFNGEISQLAKPDWQDPTTGMVWKRIEKICWHDAMDRQRPDGPCVNIQVGYQRESWVKRFLQAGEAVESVEKGCTGRFGSLWRVATDAELATTDRSTGKFFPAVTFEGYWRFGSRALSQEKRDTEGNRDYWDRNTMIYIRDYEHMSESLRKSGITSASCVGLARLIDPEGDIDSDGFKNNIDVCNRLPKIKSSPVDQSGDRVGCATDQETDADFEGSLPSTTPPKDPNDPYRMGIITKNAPEGIEIMSVEPGSVAQKSNLLVGDILVTINGRTIRTQSDVTQARLSSNGTMHIYLKRSGTLYQTTLKF